jgi:hypothetical protein
VRTRSLHRSLIAGAIALSLVAAACGDDDADIDTPDITVDDGLDTTIDDGSETTVGNTDTTIGSEDTTDAGGGEGTSSTTG